MVKIRMVDWDLFARKPLVGKFNKKETVKAFIQARTGSTRLPNKIYHDINGAPMLWHTVNKAKECKLLDDVIVISPGELPDLPDNVKGFAYGGRENDVLGRYIAALDAFPCDYVVRLTSDCPLLDPYLIDFVIGCGLGSDYCSNVLPCTFPDGMDTEMISTAKLKLLGERVNNDFDREHVTTYIRNNPSVQIEMNIVSVQAMHDQSFIKLSVDTKEDLDRVREMEDILCRR